MAVRRNMTDVLPPEQVAFIKGEAPPATVASTSGRPRPTNVGRSPRERSDTYSPAGIRHRCGLSTGLCRAKIRQEIPYTQQDIISEALKQWLYGSEFLA